MTTVRAALAASTAVTAVVVTLIAAPGTEAADHAIQSKAKRRGWTACATKRAAHPTGERSRARNRTGCARVTTGAAMRFESGAIRLIRPNTHATRGAVTAHATSDVTSSLPIR